MTMSDALAAQEAELQRWEVALNPKFAKLMATHRWCYTIPLVQDISKHGGYVPSLVIEGEKGHHPMTGNGDFQAPWVWGKTLTEAQNVCRHVNKKRGISVEDEQKIVASTF